MNPGDSGKVNGLISARALKVLVVSEDRKLVRHLSQFLNVFGYDATPAADVQQALGAVVGKQPDFVIIDAELSNQGGLELCRAMNVQNGESHVYTLWLVRAAHADKLIEALQAGVDDFLTKPIVHGEILVRLRAGARVLEYERRIQEQDGRDPVTGCCGKKALLNSLRRELTPGGNEAKSVACVMVDLNFFERINQTYGHPASDHVIHDVAISLKDLCVDQGVLYSLGGDQFCILLSKATEREAALWAEGARKALEDKKLDLGEAPVWLTASFGVAGCHTNANCPEQIFEDTQSALNLAKNSGRNCVVCHGQFQDEEQAWTQLAEPGRLFQATAARDVMTPCTLVVHPEHSVAQALALFRKTRLQVVPVVDAEDGKLYGLLFKTALDDAISGPIRDLVSRKVASCEEDASFEDLMEACGQDEVSHIVIVNQGRPTGIVRPGQLAGLTEPLTTDSFAPELGLCDTSDYLLVPDVG